MGVALLALLGAAAPCAAQDVAFRAGHLVVDSQRVLDDGVLIVRGGVVAAIRSDIPEDWEGRRVERPQAWIVPGFVDAHTGLTLQGDLDETADALAGDVSVATRLDPDHPDLAAARAAGITTCLVVPGERNLLGGAARVLETTGNPAEARPLAKLGLTNEAWPAGTRAPTSRSGALDLLRRALVEAHERAGQGLLDRFARGEVPGLVSISRGEDVRFLQELGGRYGLDLVYRLRGSWDLTDMMNLDLRGQVMVLGPYDLGTRVPALTAAGTLAQQDGLTLAFGSEAPAGPVAGLRLSAVLAVRYGLSPARAFHALTAGGAAAIGLAETLGTLAPGRRANLVVWDQAPLSLEARALEVYHGGRRSYLRPRAAEEERP